jgi:hypothetical protein
MINLAFNYSKNRTLKVIEVKKKLSWHFDSDRAFFNFQILADMVNWVKTC